MLTASSATVIPIQQPSTNGERFVRIRHCLLRSAAWRSLPADACALYVEIASRYNGRNNGYIAYSIREGAERFRAGRATVHQAQRLLEERGIIVCRKRGSFDIKNRQINASEWELTEHDCDGRPAARTFLNWVEERKDDPPRSITDTDTDAPRSIRDTDALVLLEIPYGSATDTDEGVHGSIR